MCLALVSIGDVYITMETMKSIHFALYEITKFEC